MNPSSNNDLPQAPHPANQPTYPASYPPHGQHYAGPAPQPAPQPQAPPNYNQPVAYDQQGRPLYTHPPVNTQPQMVYLARPATPHEVHIPEDVQRKHAESVKNYPGLNLSEAEYVISAVKRHPIGIIQIWAFAAILMLAFGGLFAVLMLGEDSVLVGMLGSPETATSVGMGVLGVLFALVTLGAMLATYIYNSNRFYLTNESVIQEIQTTLFNRHEQTVSLSNIEDASYKQAGVVAHLFGYATIRLSTQGDETTYMFKYVTNPKRHIAVLNNAVEAFKNGRPVEGGE